MEIVNYTVNRRSGCAWWRLDLCVWWVFFFVMDLLLLSFFLLGSSSFFFFSFFLFFWVLSFFGFFLLFLGVLCSTFEIECKKLESHFFKTRLLKTRYLCGIYTSNSASSVYMELEFLKLEMLVCIIFQTRINLLYSIPSQC